MSILISETFANPDTPLWSNAFSNQLLTYVGTTEDTRNYDVSGAQQITIFTCPASLYPVAGGAYIFTLCLTPNIEIGGTGLQPIVFTMAGQNSIGTFECGTQYLYDINQTSATSAVWMSLPFVSDGTDMGLAVYMYNASNTELSVVNIATNSESMLFLGQATQVGVIFQPN